MKRLFAVLLLAIALPVQAGDPAGLEVRDAWVPEAPPNARVLAAYMTLVNHGERERVIRSADAPGFERVELHLSKMQDGLAKMIKQERITVPAGGERVLAPGGYHIMLIGVQERPTAGDTVPVTLNFADHPPVVVEAEVRKRGAMGGHMHHHHH